MNIQDRVGYIHARRLACALDRQALAEEAATLAPELQRIAAKYGRKPSTVAKIALAWVAAA